jgi:hypothetical protein
MRRMYNLLTNFKRAWTQKRFVLYLTTNTRLACSMSLGTSLTRLRGLSDSAEPQRLAFTTVAAAPLVLVKPMMLLSRRSVQSASDDRFVPMIRGDQTLRECDVSNGL